MNETMPNNLDAEKSLISIILFDNNRFIEVADYLQATDFYEVAHSEIWQVMISLYKKGQDLDITSIKTELKKQQIDPKPAMEAINNCYHRILLFLL